MPRRRLDTDTFRRISIDGTSRRLAPELDRAAALAELRDVIADRRDLAGQALGSMLGGYIASPGTTNPTILRAAALLADAGADPDTVVEAFETARENLTTRTGPLSM